MRVVVDLLANVPDPRGSVVTIGAFDGVHLGHQMVIRQVRERAAAIGAASALVTFDRHPAMVVRPESAPKLLTGIEHKLELLAATGLDETIVVHFDTERATESPRDFVKEVLVDACGAKIVVVGEDFHFGKGRAGNVAMLKTLGAEFGFEVFGLGLVDASGHETASVDAKVSSTLIREAVAAGDMRAAAAGLGRHREVRGTVIHGDARGRTLGFPTANVAVSADTCLPADGIYAGWYVRPNGERLPAAINLGRRPTFYEDQPYSLLEAFIIDWSGDLYDEPARVQFVELLRPELKFTSLDALIEQMHADVARASTILAADT